MEEKENKFAVFTARVKKCFTDHPESVGESYGQHLRIALWSGLQLVWAGLALIIHSIVPCVFVNTASDTVQKINREMTERRNRRIEKP